MRFERTPLFLEADKLIRRSHHVVDRGGADLAVRPLAGQPLIQAKHSSQSEAKIKLDTGLSLVEFVGELQVLVMKRVGLHDWQRQ